MLKDIELKAVGLDEETKKMQEGYFISFRNIGLPIHKEDYDNPWSPLGVNLEKNIPKKEPSDPKDAPKTGSEKIDTTQAFVASVAKSQQSYLNTFVLVDNKLQMNNQYSVMPGSSKLSDTWFAIITGANGIPTDMELSDELKAAYKAATDKLMDADGNPTPHYQAYMKYEDEWKSKVRARNKAYAAAFTDPMKLQQWPSDGVLYQEDVDEAWNRWMGLGFKVEIEKAIDTLAAQGTDPAIALIARAKKRFQNSLFEFAGYGEIPYTLLSPRTWYDRDNDDGWNTYTTTDLHSESHFTASQTSFGGGAGVNLGLWSAGANFEHDESQANASASVKNMKISFSYAIVDIDRPWLVGSLLNLNNWFLVGDYKKNCISTGKMGQEKPGDGTEPSFLPSVVTSLILAKDVLVSWDDWEQQWASHTESNSGSASVGVWCFTASAHYSHATQSRDFVCDVTGEGLSIPGIQVIGYVSQIMPPCPQRNSSDFMKKPKTN
jgi:hypothetical protein